MDTDADYKEAYHQLLRRKVVCLSALFGGFIYLGAGMWTITHFHLYRAGSYFHWQTWMLFGTWIASQFAWWRYRWTFRCPRCGDFFFWPDQLRQIKACVHCGLRTEEIYVRGRYGANRPLKRPYTDGNHSQHLTNS